MKQKNDLDNLRHSAAHLLAAAVMKLWPDTKRTIGPVIENGFYYDFDFSKPLSEDDLPKIEQTMKEIVKSWKGFERHEVTADAALKEYKDNEYKRELIDEFASQGQKLTIYQSGDFRDLCRGGHCDNPSKELQHFKLLSVAGAYWRGSEKNPMLTRIYGTVFPTKKELDEFLDMREEAKKRDHRKLGKELDLFTFSALVGPGLPLWTPRGALMRQLIDEYVWELRKAKGYARVTIPHITKYELYEKSGHWQKYSEELYKINTREGHVLVMKPMNCPHHVQIFDRKKHSYREMPQRFAETTMVYRDEQSGELNGLSRVISITQDDAHVFCRYTQVKEEALNIWDIVKKFYGAFDIPLKIRLSLHDPKQFDRYLGEKKVWEAAEDQLRQLIREQGAEAVEATGEAAFYGPKIDFMGIDSLGRQWQVATIQLDMNQPERFDLTCINEEGKDERIVMLHAAIAGSLERFLSIIIEHLAGAFPLWLSPVQVRIASVGKDHHAFCHELAQKLNDAGVRADVDDSNETVGNKIRKSSNEKIPYTLVIGDKEITSKELAVRIRGNKEIVPIQKDTFMRAVAKKIASRSNSLELV